MLTGLNSYNSSVQYNNRPRFGQLTTKAAQEMYEGLKLIVRTPGDRSRLYKFDTGFIGVDTKPKDIREVAQHIREVDQLNDKGWRHVADALEHRANWLSEL